MFVTLAAAFYAIVALFAVVMSLAEALGNPLRSAMGVMAGLAWPLLVPVMILTMLWQTQRGRLARATVARPVARAGTRPVLSRTAVEN